MNPLETPAPPGRWRWLLAANLVAVLAVGAWFRVHDRDHFPGINGDETYTSVQVARFLETRDLHSEKVLVRGFSGRYLDVVTVAYFLPLMAALKPSYALVRSYPMAVGLLTVGLAYVMTGRAWGRATGLILALAVAAAPVCVAYSRMSWEPSLIPLFGVVVLSFAARGRWGATLLALPFGYSMHPTNLLLLPLVAFLLLAARLREREVSRSAVRRLVAFTGLATALTGLLGALVLWKFDYPLPYDAWRSPTEWASFALWFGRLLSGVTVYRYFVGTPHPGSAVVHDVVFWAIAIALLVAGVPGLVRRGQWDRLGVVVWAFAQPWVLFLAAGAYVLRPPHNRYGLVLVVPALLALTFLVRSRFEDLAADGARRRRGLLTAGLVVLLWAWLADFQRNYFDPLRRTGGESYLIYRTAAVEPKRQVYKILRADLAARRGVSAPVLVDNFFLFWALEYLALPRPEMACAMLSPFGVVKPEAQAAVVSRVEAGAYLVSWSGSPVEARVLGSVAPERLRTWLVRDGAGRPLISVLRLRDPGETPVASAAGPLRR